MRGPTIFILYQTSSRDPVNIDQGSFPPGQHFPRIKFRLAGSPPMQLSVDLTLQQAGLTEAAVPLSVPNCPTVGCWTHDFRPFPTMDYAKRGIEDKKLG
jgi:hypothetical protein